jgi:hypothetical protein
LVFHAAALEECCWDSDIGAAGSDMRSSEFILEVFFGPFYRCCRECWSWCFGVSGEAGCVDSGQRIVWFLSVLVSQLW